MKLSKSQREEIRMMFGGFCAYCGVPLTGKWHVDHVEPIGRGSKYVRDSKTGCGKMVSNGKVDFPDRDCRENLWPSCSACNINKSSLSIEAWRKFLAEGPSSLASYNGRFKHMLRFGIVQVNPKSLEFWFEKYTKEQP